MTAGVAPTGVVGIVGDHLRSLPYDARRNSLIREWPWFSGFVVLPALAGGVSTQLSLTDQNFSTVLAGVGVLGGLLFQVLAWVSSRIAGLADGMDGREATKYEIALIGRLDIARANIAYAALTSIGVVLTLGFGSALEDPPTWLIPIFIFLLFHLGANLVLVVVRISEIARSDRVAALTAHARDRTT